MFLYQLFLQILDMAVTACPVIIIVLLMIVLVSNSGDSDLSGEERVRRYLEEEYSENFEKITLLY